MPVEEILYVAHAQATGGREGRAHTDDRVLDVALTMPRELGGNGASGSNPEQLFAAGYSACFLGALNFVASQQKIKLSAHTRIDGFVGIGPIPTGFGIEVELKISLPELDESMAQELVEKAHIVCPYSNATSGNINVKLTLI
ncbi:organic hydroperoxide resistance protein [Pseudomonas sp. CFBP 8770]|uniref:organic hydroperoxide resistance protein n=1 Tax=unclassified Pseudomonas TaxID=196821 RepID=UPI00177FDD68|nr:MULTISPECIES: organic hydroperoxide resistance protein [unclassified Pseudomonas]MBD8473186.1 organic hydroperoxide resistance protein [Pseudomonas sp. CFBP 8773]MBD8595928.1 organic hydroperoxide resistance protein [Pseudomonas sp. CFBP 8758]MBD8646313.1 organic hydroperoxide resistance protein [Pseudomonas sp. CFBP 8770]MBD8733533.1 organic hydroperoxide resistance protein [Pseudomonas sp. CFBP 13710]